MLPAHRDRPPLRISVVAAFVFMGGLGTLRASPPQATGRLHVSAELSPVAEGVAPNETWRLAESYAATRVGMQVFVGSGDSMLPLYPSRTVLVVQAMNMSDLRRGMTVIFIGDHGRPVAHTLVENTARGWIAMGLGNAEPDQRTVQFRNYIGTVVKAYVPTRDVPAMANAETVEARASTVSMAHSGPVYFEGR